MVRNIAKAQDELDQVEHATRDAIGEVRFIARGLSLPDIEERPLADLLQPLALSHSEHTGTEVAFSSRVQEVADLSTAVKTCVFRVAQEGLTNAWRHGGGIAQEVGPEIDGDRLTLTVHDRGGGEASSCPSRRKGNPVRCDLTLRGICDE